MSTIPKYVLLAVSLASLAVGFLSGAWIDPFDHVTEDGKKPLPIDLGAPGRYVALGDSFSAGEGLEPFQESTRDIDEGGDRCHRSESFAYPLLLSFSYPTTTLFRACAGAVVDDFFDVVQVHGGLDKNGKQVDIPNSQGIQVGKEILAPDDVKLVTLTIGGNDLDFAKALRFCFENTNCTNQPYKGYKNLSDWVDARLPELQDRLVPLYQRLRQSFPSARILVLGYPALFPEHAPPLSELRRAECTLLFTKWTSTEREAIRDWGVRLNRMIQTATDRARAGIEFVDISSFFTGHEPCSTGGEWVRFVGVSTHSAIREGSFHPLSDGQMMMARIVSCYLHVFTTVGTPATETTGFAMTGCLAQETQIVLESPPPLEPTGSSSAPA